MATDCTYPSGAPIVQNLRDAPVQVGKAGASCDETCAKAGRLCDGDTLAGIKSAHKLRRLLVRTNVSCNNILTGSNVVYPTISNICRDPSSDGLKCGPGKGAKNRLFTIHGAEATLESCILTCAENVECMTFSSGYADYYESFFFVQGATARYIQGIITTFLLPTKSARVIILALQTQNGLAPVKLVPTDFNAYVHAPLPQSSVPASPIAHNRNVTLGPAASIARAGSSRMCPQKDWPPRRSHANVGEVFDEDGRVKGRFCSLPYWKRENIDAGVGSDYAPSLSTLQECETRCNDDEQCLGYAYGRHVDKNYYCHLRNRIEPSGSNIGNPDWQYFHTYIRANQWVLIADVQSTTVTNKIYWESVCANRGDMAVNDTMKIVMGEVTDFRPSKDMTLCEFLTSPSTDKKFRWAATEDGPYWGKVKGLGIFVL